MEEDLKGRYKLMKPNFSVQAFSRRVIITLTILITVSTAAIFLLIYLPLNTELKKSLIGNFNQLSYIRYSSLQSIMDRSLEGARSLSSRTVIRDAILDYKDEKFDLEALKRFTQSKYEDGAGALEYLLKAERFVDEDLIARYTSEIYDEHCTVLDQLKVSGEESALCLTDNYEYFVVRSSILSQGRVIGYDLLFFNLSGQIHSLCTETIKSELLYQDKFEDLISGANILQKNDISSLIYKDGIYYHEFYLQGGVHFIISQNEVSLLEPVYRLSKQMLLAGIGVLLLFALGVYFFIVRHARNEMEDNCTSLSDAISEVNTDSLTKTGSRRFGEEFLSVSFERFKMGEQSPAILLFDIDSFKMINDLHGHSVGDLVIRSVAETVQKSIRAGDVLLRWGGDEFIGVFSGLNKEDAIAFAKKLLYAVSNLNIDTDTDIIRPTISIGISYFLAEDHSFIDATNRADSAMYQSKSEGRNRVHKL